MKLKDTKLPNTYKWGIMGVGLSIEAFMLLFLCGQLFNPLSMEAIKEVGLAQVLCLIFGAQLIVGYISYMIGEQIGAMATIIRLEIGV